MTPLLLPRHVLCVALLFLGSVVAAAPNVGIDMSAMDPSVRPQDDLYRHVNGHWLRDTSIPPERSSVGSGDEMYNRTQARLRGLVESAAADSGDADARKIAALYASFMDEAALEPLGLKPLSAELQAIDAITDRDGLATAFARFNRLGAGTPVVISIDQDSKDSSHYVPTLQQGGLGLPNRDYYLELGDAKFREAREKYVEYMTRLLTLAQAPDPAASAQAVLALETRLATVQWSAVQNRDPIKTYNPTDLADLPKAAPALPWTPFLSAAGLSERTRRVVIAQPSYFSGLSSLLEQQPLDTWKTYARLRLIGAYSPYLGHDFVDAQFAFFYKALRGREENRPRWERGVQLVDHSIGEALGKRYVDRWFPPESKARVEAMVANLLEACRQSISTRSWMTPPTRREALVKLAKFMPKIGYPSRWIDYSRLDIRSDDLVGNVMRADNFEYERQVSKLGQPIDRGEWGMTPQTVNAYYNGSLNEIVFPAAILQEPEFDAKGDDAVNYGGIGAVIGHEISHGFDDEGSQFDGDGNLRDWWNEQDKARFKAKTKILVSQYAAFSPIPGYFVNGELTLGENIADNSGLEIAYKAWKLSLRGRPSPVIDGLTGDQRFFIGFAQSWRSKTRDEAMLNQIKSDPHSPDEIRVNGTVRNHPDFYAAFGVKPGDKMYLPPARRVSIW